MNRLYRFVATTPLAMLACACSPSNEEPQVRVSAPQVAESSPRGGIKLNEGSHVGIQLSADRPCGATAAGSCNDDPVIEPASAIGADKP